MGTAPEIEPERHLPMRQPGRPVRELLSGKEIRQCEGEARKDDQPDENILERRQPGHISKCSIRRSLPVAALALTTVILASRRSKIKP